MAGIGEYLYDSWPLAQKYAWMRIGAGPAGAIMFGDDLRALANRFDVSGGTIGWNLTERGLGTGWHGAAATAAGGAFGRAAAALDGIARTGGRGGETAHRYGDSFTAARNAVPEPVEVGENSFWGRQADELGASLDDSVGSSFGIQSDYQARLVAHHEADRIANDVLKRHEQATREALAAFTVADTEPAPPTPGTDGSDAGQQPGGGLLPSDGSSAAGADGSASVPAGGGAAGGGRAAGGGGAAGGELAGGGQVGPPTTTEAAAETRGPTGSIPTTGAGAIGAGGAGPTNPTGAGPTGGSPISAGPSAGAVPAVPGGRSSWVPLDSPRPSSPGWVRTPVGDSPHSTGNPALAARGGGPGTAGDPTTTSGRSSTGAGRPAGIAGMPPMGMGASGFGADSRTHRNQTYLPDDEPFRVEFTDFAPPVLGVPEPERD